MPELDKELEHAQRVYKDILNGYSEIPNLKNQGEIVYIKHLSDLDHGWMKDYKNSIYTQAKSDGLFTYKEKVESLIEQELWSKDKDLELEQIRTQLSRLIETKSKLIIKFQKDQLQKEIEEKEKRVNELSYEKESLIGITCENYSSKKVNERYLYLVSYKDRECTKKLWTEEEFEDMTDIELSALIGLNNIKMEDFSDESMKITAAAPFFLNSMMLCKDNPFVFFGKPIYQLTNYQIELFSNGIRYKGLIERTGKTPPPLSTLTESYKFYEEALATQMTGEKNDVEVLGTASSMVGATAEEMEKMAEAEGGKNVVNLASQTSKIMKEKGSTKLSMDDLMKIHGED